MIEKRGRLKTIVCDNCNTNRTTCCSRINDLLKIAKQQGWENEVKKYKNHKAYINICPECLRGEKKLTFTRSQASANRLTNKSDEELEQIKEKLKTALSEDEVDTDNCTEIVGIAYITAKNFISGKTRPSKVTMRKMEEYLEVRDDR